MQNTAAVGSSSSLTAANGTTLDLRQNSAASFTAPALALPTGAANSVTINVDNAGSGTGNTLTLSGGISLGASASAGTITVNVTAGNSYVLNLPTLTVNGTGGTTAMDIKPASGSVTIGTFSATTLSNKDGDLVLDGTTTGNTISTINSATGGGWTYLTKQGSGTGTWAILPPRRVTFTPTAAR